MTDLSATTNDVLAFWRAAGPDKWFNKDEAFDAEIRSRFLQTHEAAVAGTLAPWKLTADGALALCIVLDQFPRNMFRGSARTLGKRLNRSIRQPSFVPFRPLAIVKFAWPPKPPRPAWSL